MTKEEFMARKQERLDLLASEIKSHLDSGDVVRLLYATTLYVAANRIAAYSFDDHLKMQEHGRN